MDGDTAGGRFSINYENETEYNKPGPRFRIYFVIVTSGARLGDLSRRLADLNVQT